MKLTRASSYALTALAQIADRKEQTPIASHVVAQADGSIPERFLLKILKPLVSAGVLRSVKGPNGGYSLTRPAKDITLLEVIEAVDGPIHAALPETRDGKENAALDRHLQTVFDETTELIRDKLGAVTIQDLAGKGKVKAK